MAYRFYLPDAKAGKRVRLDSEQVRHLKVLRITKSENISVFDGKGNEFEAAVLDQKTGEIEIKKQIQAGPEPKTRITIAIAVPKLARFDWLVEKASELGAKSIVPILCERCVVKPSEAKIQRAQKIAIDACSQSKRATLTIVEKPEEFEQVLQRAREFELCIICTPKAEPLRKVYTGQRKVLVLIGPEGGFTDEEQQKALASGFKPTSLGPTTLRIETAAITVMAQIIALEP